MELSIKERKSDEYILVLRRGEQSNHHVFNVLAYSNFLLKNGDYKTQREIVDFFNYILVNIEIITIFELTKKTKETPIINSLEMTINDD